MIISCLCHKTLNQYHFLNLAVLEYFKLKPGEVAFPQVRDDSLLVLRIFSGSLHLIPFP